MDHGEGKWSVDDKFSNADTGSIEKRLRGLNSRIEQFSRRIRNQYPHTSGFWVS